MKKGMLCLLCLAFCLCACGRQRGNGKETRELFAMDTYMTLTVYGEGADEALALLAEEITTLERQFSAAREDGEIGSLNRNGTAELSDETLTLLRRCLALERQTGRAFCVGMYPVVCLWGFPTGAYRVPTEAEIQAALAKTDLRALQIEGNRVTLPEGAQLDFGAAAKGYAGQKCAQLLSARGDCAAILSLGGNVQTVGTKSDGSKWQVAVQDPFGEGYAAQLAVEGTKSIVTSGSYQRYFEQDGRRYGHIFDAQTGYPAQSGLASVTVVADDGTLADALSTALFVMGLEKGTAFWRDTGGFEAIFITEDGEVYVTSGLAADVTGCTFAEVAP